MEGTESTTRERTTGKDENQAADQKLLMSSKPLHRFTQKEPRSLGIVILMFGCAEVLMGFVLSQDTERIVTSHKIYIPFWQGALFLVCGSLSIYTEIQPSKKSVTLCLAMYVVTLLGILVSIGYRIFVLIFVSHFCYRGLNLWNVCYMVCGTEGILFTSSLCVLVLLIILCTVARLALKSTRTQVIVQHILPPLSDAT